MIERWRRGRAQVAPDRDGERGATFSEYSLILVALVTVTLGVVAMLEEGSSSYLVDAGSDIGIPRSLAADYGIDPPVTPPTLPQPPAPPTPLTVNWNLGSGGATTAQSILPLNETPTGGTLPNYDTDRDSDEGLWLDQGSGVYSTDSDTLQRWAEPVGDERVAGTPVLTIWVASKDYDTSDSGQIETALFDCDASHNNCLILSNGSGTFSQSAFGADFGSVTISMNPIDKTFDPGRTLVLTVAAHNASTADIWVAYGTTTYPSSFTVS